jgi:tetratricopeptide (TPR) repeat protein
MAAQGMKSVATLTLYDEAIRLDPQLADAYYNRGVACESQGQQGLSDRDVANAKELEDAP